MRIKIVLMVLLVFIMIFAMIQGVNAQNKPKYIIIFSTVLSISANKLVLKETKEGEKPRTVIINDQTKFFGEDGRTETKWRDLKAGDEVTVKCLQGDKLQAVRIRKGYYVEI